MATSSTYTFESSQLEIITDALLLVRGIGANEGVEEQYLPCERTLNRMLKSWHSKFGLPWLKQEVFVFPASATSMYLLGPASSDAEWCDSEDFVETDLSVAAATSATSLTVDSTTGMAASDRIGIELDDGTRDWTTIVSVDSSTTLTITTGLTSAAAVDNSVYTYTTRPQRPLRVLHARRRVGSNDIPVDVISHEDYHDEVNKSSAGTLTELYYKPTLTSGRLFVWQIPGIDEPIGLTVAKPLLDVNETSETLEVPIEWEETVVYNLAARLSPAWGHLDAVKTQELLGQAVRMETELEMHSIDQGSVFLTPDKRD